MKVLVPKWLILEMFVSGKLVSGVLALELVASGMVALRILASRMWVPSNA